MSISINWNTHVIFVPQSFLVPLGGSLYKLDTDLFRLALRNIEDDEIGVTQPATHKHNTEVSLGGVVYARIIEILSPYTITFEETGSPYTVTLLGSNNNILDKTNIGSVQILSNNSAGLVNTGLNPEDIATATATAVWSAVSTDNNAAGTMGNKLNTASTGGVDYQALADAIRVELTPELTHLMLLENGLTPAQATVLQEIYQLYGLDPTKPLIVTQTSRQAGAGIQQQITTGPTQTTIMRV